MSKSRPPAFSASPPPRSSDPGGGRARQRAGLLLAAIVLALVPRPATAEGEAAKPAHLLALRPVPENIPSAEQDKLRVRLALMQGAQKYLKEELDAYFAKYGSEISPQAKEYPDFLATRERIVGHNDRLTKSINDYNSETLAALDAEAKRLQERIDGFRQNFERLGKSSAQRSAASSELGDLSAQERDALLETLRDRAKDAAFEAGELGVEKALERATRINPAAAKKIIDRLKKAGADNPHLLELIEAVGNAKNKQERLERAKKLYEMLKNEKTLWTLGDLADREEYLAALIEITSWLSPSPFLTVCAEGLFDVVKANLAAWLVLAPNVDLLNNSSEARLRDLKVLAEQQVELINQRKRVRQERKELPARVAGPPDISLKPSWL